MPFYDSKGNLVSGAKVGGKGGGGSAVSIVATEVDASVARVKEGASARDEMLALFRKHPFLKEDKWEVGEHPLSPLLEWFVKQQLD
jgi:galactokinase